MYMDSLSQETKATAENTEATVSFTPDLQATRFKARAWSHKYNSYFTSPDSKPDFDTLAKERAEMLKSILGKCDDTVFIDPPFAIGYGCNISFGKRFYSNFNLTILDCSIVTIGNRVFVRAECVHFCCNPRNGGCE